MNQSHYIQPVDLIEKPNKISRAAKVVVRSLSFGCLSRPKDNTSFAKYKVNHYIFNAKNKKLKQKLSDDMTNVRIEDFERFIEEELLDDITVATNWSDTSLDQYFA